jgi:hypothetical protein
MKMEGDRFNREHQEGRVLDEEESAAMLGKVSYVDIILLGPDF